MEKRTAHRWRAVDLPPHVIEALEAIEAIDWGDVPPGGYPRAAEAEASIKPVREKPKPSGRKARQNEPRDLFGER